MSKKEHVPAVQESANVPAEHFDYSQYADQGFETHTRDDYAVPFLGVLQSNSPLLNDHATARAGMLFNTVTQKVYDGKAGVCFVPAFTDHVVVEWKPRDSGGGFVAIHQLGTPLLEKVKAEQEFGKWKTVKGDPKSNDLIETFYVYGVFIAPDGSYEQMIIAFSSTKIKAYKRWMTKARTLQIAMPKLGRRTPPLFSHRYRITSVSEKNPKGSYFNFHVEFDSADREAVGCRLPTNDPLFESAVGFADLVKKGNLKAAYDTQTQATSEAEEEIPFA